MLNVKGLSKKFLIHILNDTVIDGFGTVNFKMGEGCSLGISGPSGAGKSSILKCIYRRYLPSSGNINYESSQFGNVDLSTAPERVVLKIRENEIGYITQFLKVIPRIPCVDIVAEPLISSGVNINEAREISKDLLNRLSIPLKLFNAYPSTFSGGEQQRVNIARAVIRRQRLLMIDEPTASLDHKATEIVLEIFNELKNAGTAMIGVFHDKEVLSDFSDEIYYLEA